MKFSINIDIELTDEEIQFLKSKFLENRNKSWNLFYEKANSGSDSQYFVMKTLREKNIIYIDNLENSLPTLIGNKILDLFDRDKKIDDLLNGNT